MKHTITAAGLALALTSTTALAGGLDRSGQGIGVLFEKGNVVELSFGGAAPSVSGFIVHPLAGPLPSGDIAPNYMSMSLALKQDLSDKLSFALIMDQPFGAAVDYTVVPSYPLPDVTANLSSQSITALGRYKISDRFSVHGGLRFVTMSGETFTSDNPATTTVVEPPLTLTFAGSSDVAVVVGAAFEIPDIALRAAVTYSSETNHDHIGSPLPFVIPAYKMPQSVNFDFQTGIAANTLLFGSVRWVDWTSTVLTTPVGTIDYTEDTMTYSLGVGRKFSDAFSGALTLGYEEAQGGFASNLSPTDGYFSVGLGGSYTSGNMKISGGVRYVDLGDATAEVVSPALPGANFSGNSAIGVGVKVAFSF